MRSEGLIFSGGIPPKVRRGERRMKAEITSVPLHLVASWELLNADYAIKRVAGRAYLFHDGERFNEVKKV